MSNPEISIIIPLYNSAKFIGKCINSLLDQNCTASYEIIVVNDGSTDNSLDIVKQLADTNSCIQIVNQSNAGVSAARNTGIRIATGEYVAFVDSDDYVSPDYLSSLHTAARQHDADIVCCNYRNITGANNSGLDNFLFHTRGVYGGRQIMRAALRDITVRSYVWNKLFRRQLFTENSITFPVGVSFEDFAVIPQLFFRAQRVAFINDVLYYYVHHAGSITGSINKKGITGYVMAFATLRRFMENENIFRTNKVIFHLLKDKISITIFGMLLRCWWREPKTTHVLTNYISARRFLNIYASDKYYFASGTELELSIQ